MKSAALPLLTDEGPAGRRRLVRTRLRERDHLHQRRILLAEGDGRSRRLLRRLLREDGHRVVAVRDGMTLLGEVAATLLEGEAAPFDLIVAEQRLPGISGLSVLAALRACDWTTPFILIAPTADATAAEQARLLEAVVLTRPFATEALLRAVSGSDAPAKSAP